MRTKHLFLASLTTALSLTALPAQARVAPTVASLTKACTYLPGGATDDQQARLVRELQCVRHKAGLKPFKVDARLSTVADAWTAQLASSTVVSHNPALLAAVSAVAPRWRTMGEVVDATATGRWQVDRTVTAWLQSPLHRANLLRPNFKVIGIGWQIAAGRAWATVDLVDRR